MTLAATLTLAQAARRTWDVAVVGAGPAGALAARQIATAGASTLLIDRARFPRWKVCGACLNDRVLATLRDIGLGDLPGRLGAIPLTKFSLAGWKRHAVIALPAGVSLSRSSFDAALIEAAIDSGAAFLPETRATIDGASREDRADHHSLRLVQREISVNISARVLVAADGLSNQLLARDEAFHSSAAAKSRIGSGTVVVDAPSFYAQGVIYMAVGDTGYVGLVRVEDGLLNIAAALDPGAVRDCHGPAPVAARILEQAGFPSIDTLATAEWRGTPPLTRRATSVAARRLFVLGDAAGYVEPFTGEGIAWATSAAVAVAPLACQAALEWNDELAAQWRRRYASMVRQRQWLCRAMAFGLKRPLLVRAGLRILSRMPGLATPVTHRLNARGIG